MDKIADRQAPWLKEINGADAHELIESDSQVICVVAGPGSGKTTCLKRRIQRLIQKNNINPETIFVGAFTRAIAKATENEIHLAVGAQVKVSTIHSLAYELLRKYPIARQGMKLRFLLKYEEDALLYDVQKAIPDMGNKTDLEKAMLQLQSSRDQRKKYENARFSEEVRRWLRRHRAMLIGEVVHLCVVALERHDMPSGLFDHVVIDEYQDLTAAEQELVRHIWSGSGSLTVMGDDDQSIYGFRFAHPEGITSFSQDWPNCKKLTFINNYRCGKRILDIANLMMAEANSKKRPMVSMTDQLGNMKLVDWVDLDKEIAGLAGYIRCRPKESFLVLVPRRFIGKHLAEAIGSDAKTAFSDEPLTNTIGQEAFATASLLADPEDYVAVRAYFGFQGTKRKYALKRNADAYASLPGVASHALSVGCLASQSQSAEPHSKA